MGRCLLRSFALPESFSLISEVLQPSPSKLRGWISLSCPLFAPAAHAGAVCLLIVTSGPHAAPMVGAARTTKENSMSTVLTIAALQPRSDLELQNLLRKARYDLECTAT